MSTQYIDDMSGISTTGHEWDGIRELNNPLPRWWVVTFYVTIAWAIGYTIAYPAWPMLTFATKGALGYSSRNDVNNKMAAAEAAKAKYVAAIQSKSVSEIAGDDALREFAVSAGGAAFKVNCVQCHGSGAQGSKGFPNLNDDDWLWGGKTGEIQQTITHGIRFTADGDTRQSEMPAFVDVLKPEQIAQVSAFVARLSGTIKDKSLIEPGAKVFAENCAVCHGENAKGNREFGAPDLTDAIWLYGPGETAIAAQVRTPKQGVMPAWIERLGEIKVKELAVYVHSLGGGE
ncbi:cytochrome-c oxidase, cbb3-type subunit III [Mesorhizobium sp. VK25A]|uniref:Cbb3-type cytochrome c oxidase subunit n=1 Tax=Mesorhizobium vachelliae TaxID=3072309 RepID=A0ABU5ADN5_9HYPH|nr:MULTISPECIES: cytochrome-c oxidase, cbb3-type subunit III [unclassified Mesorhizobium]MDX8508433.1 cytochrome-c oxidase, cbb3-type subunit III [Mesorhizobium sp. VK22E]MDX8535385.1 cytochrome-c oxidase, cbb3-type subunit III [Mesorhizobium sp. VK25D]MDX8546885.1 cytochrome-c oxidase, cbb3-type subunit III [Mesorhizobium sp. VK25A]